MTRTALKTAVILVVLILGAAQFVQPERANPPADPGASFEAVAKPPHGAGAVVARACRDCHSHQTTWPWYSKISPVSWLVASDVKEGRARLNLSQWNLYGPEMSKIRMGEMCRQAQGGKMPLWQYKLLHSEARLSPADVAALCGM